MTPGVHHAADELWLTSTREGLPNVMLEALCCARSGGGQQPTPCSMTTSSTNINGRHASPEPEVLRRGRRGCLFAFGVADARQAIADRARCAYDADKLCREFAARLAAITGLTTQGATTMIDKSDDIGAGCASMRSIPGFRFAVAISIFSIPTK